MRDVGDGDIQAEAAGKALPATGLLAIDGIVEVTRIFAVDGDERQMTQVDTLLLVLLLHLGLEPGRFAQYGFGPDMRDIETAQRHVDLHPRRHVVADDLDDVALRLEALGRPMGDLHLDELARLGVHRPPRRDQHFLLDLGVVGHDEADTALFLIAPHDALVGTADHLDDRAFPTSTTIEPGNPRQTAVAVEDQAHLRGAEKEVVALVVGNEETEAIAMAADAPADQIQLVHRGIGAAPSVDQLAVALHGA